MVATRLGSPGVSVMSLRSVYSGQRIVTANRLAGTLVLFTSLMMVHLQITVQSKVPYITNEFFYNLKHTDNFYPLSALPIFLSKQQTHGI